MANRERFVAAARLMFGRCVEEWAVGACRRGSRVAQARPGRVMNTFRVSNTMPALVAGISFGKVRPITAISTMQTEKELE
jgi:hypothetical protein